MSAARRAGAITAVAACMVAGTVGSAAATPVAAPDQVYAPNAARLPFSDREVARVLGSAKDDVSFSVRDRRTGATYTYNGRMRNVTASIVKVLVLATIVRERREDGLPLSSSQKSLASRMIRYSDNDATSSLFRQAGGRWAVQRMADDLGLTSTTVKGSWGLTTTSAADQRLLMDRLVGGTPVLQKRDRDYILGLMRRVTPEQRWGVGTVPRGGVAAVKNGWLPYGSRGWRVNSIGSVTGAGHDYTLAILTYDNGSMDTGVSRTKKISNHVWSKLTPRRTQVAGMASAGRPYWLKTGAAMPPYLFG